MSDSYDEVSMVDQDWMDGYKEFIRDYRDLFETGNPHDAIFRTMIFATGIIPDREDVSCLLDLSQGNVKEALKKIPTNPHSCRCVLAMAAMEGYAEVVDAVLVNSSEPLVTTRHLDLAAHGGHFDVVDRLIESNEITEFDIANLTTQVESDMGLHLRQHISSSWGCAIM